MTLTTTLTSFLATRNAAAVNIPVLQPADPFLDMAGEDLRRRIFLTESETGNTLCLRPEFTIPVCLDHIATKAHTPQRYWYVGEVFRQRREGGNEFYQAGIEDLGEPDLARADARSLADAHALITAALPNVKTRTSLGDQAVFEAVLAALGLPGGWRMRLARAFGVEALLSAALQDLGRPAGVSSVDDDAAALIGDEVALANHIAKKMKLAGIAPSSGRSPQEIARRMMEKHELTSVRLSPKALAALTEFLSIHVPLRQAPAALSAFAIKSGLALDGALERFGARVEACVAEGLDLSAISYDAAFGRPLDYYTGMVFELFVDGQPKPLVGGGRYDRLLTLLGASSSIPGVGFSVWLDRIEQVAAQ